MRRRLQKWQIDVCPVAKKRTYLSFETAEEFCFDNMSPYKCDSYPHWHVGHCPSWKQVWYQAIERELVNHEYEQILADTAS